MYPEEPSGTQRTKNRRSFIYTRGLRGVTLEYEPRTKSRQAVLYTNYFRIPSGLLFHGLGKGIVPRKKGC